MDCMDLAQDKDKSQAVVKTLMNLSFPWNPGNLLTIKLVASEEVLCSMEVVS